MTDEKSLREKLDAMIRRTEPQFLTALPPGRIYTVALDLLREKEERETPCVWKARRFGYDSSCGNSYGRLAVINGEGQFCPGCGHPIVVKKGAEHGEV